MKTYNTELSSRPKEKIYVKLMLVHSKHSVNSATAALNPASKRPSSRTRGNTKLTLYKDSLNITLYERPNPFTK